MKYFRYELFKFRRAGCSCAGDRRRVCRLGRTRRRGSADTVAACVNRALVLPDGRDPRQIEDIWQSILRGGFYRGGRADIRPVGNRTGPLGHQGQALRRPGLRALGGRCRTACRLQLDRRRPPDDVAEAVKKQLASGFKAVKLNATEELHYIDSHEKIDAVLARVAAVREVGGPGLGIGIDFHGRVHKAMAKVLARELEPYRRCSSRSRSRPRTWRHCATSPPCARPIRDRRTALHPLGFQDAAPGRLCRHHQPDVSHAGGILECRKIAAMAEAYDVALAPQLPAGTDRLASCLQLDAARQCRDPGTEPGDPYNVGNDVLDYCRPPGDVRLCRRICRLAGQARIGHRDR